MKNTLTALFVAADEKLDALSAHMGSADKRVIERHDALDERMSEKFNTLFGKLNDFANMYFEMQRKFGHTGILPV